MVISAVRLVCQGAVCAVFPQEENAYRPYVLRHAVLGFLNALLLVATLGVTAIISLTPDVARLSTIASPTILRLANAERVKAGRAPLQEDALLQRSAELKASDMLRHDYFEHTSPSGVTPWKWFDDVRYDYLYAGENLAIDFLEAEDVVAAWMRSAGHRRNLLSDRYTDIGIAVATGEFEGRTTTIAVQHFGSPRGTTAGLPVVRGRQSPENQTVLAPPVITEPVAGAQLGRRAVAVRGQAPPGSTVRVLLDGTLLTTVVTAGTSFTSTILTPDDIEGPATLTAVAIRERVRSAPSRPIVVHLDTRAPVVAQDRATLLPDPQHLPGTVLLAVPATPDVAQATLRVSGEGLLPLAKVGSLLAARVRLADLLTSPTSAPVLAVSDTSGNRREVELHTLFPYVTQQPSAHAQRPRVAAAARRARPLLSVALGVVAFVFLINLALHVRRHRLLHADIFAHALVVLTVGIVLLIWT